MKPSIAARLDHLSRRLAEIREFLSSETATRDREQYRKLAKEQSDLTPIVELFGRYREAEADCAAAMEMLADPQMKAYADGELKAGRDRLESLETQPQKRPPPKNPNDERNIFLEIRAGTGGGGAAVFAW